MLHKTSFVISVCIISVRRFRRIAFYTSLPSSKTGSGSKSDLTVISPEVSDRAVCGLLADRLNDRLNLPLFAAICKKKKERT